MFRQAVVASRLASHAGMGQAPAEPVPLLLKAPRRKQQGGLAPAVPVPSLKRSGILSLSESFNGFALGFQRTLCTRKLPCRQVFCERRISAAPQLIAPPALS